MTFAFKLALRYLKTRRQSLARMTSLIAVIGIGAGVAGLITAEALARGFQTEMQSKLLANTSHIAIYQVDGDELKNWRELQNQIEKIENVAAVLPDAYENALLVSGQTTNYAVLRLKTDQHFAKEDVIAVGIGSKLAEKAALAIGDQAEIIIPAAQGVFAPKTSKVVVREIFQTGLYDYDSIWIRVSPPNMASLYQRSEFFPSVLSVNVKDVYASDKTAAAIRAHLAGEFKVIDWQEANRPLFAALSLEKKVAFAVISLIIFIAALNITTTLALLVNERRLDIAVLRSCGAKTKSLVAIFVFEGIIIGIIGISSGIIFGLILCGLGNYLKIISLPDEIYALNYIPLRPTLSSIWQITAVTFLLVLLSSLYPAWKAARIKPLENLRNH